MAIINKGVKRLTKEIQKTFDGFIDEEVAQYHSQKIWDDVEHWNTKLINDDMPPLYDDPKEIEDYVVFSAKSFLEEKTDMTVPELKKGAPDGIIGGEKFSKWRGYTDKEIDTFYKGSEKGDMVDPDGHLLFPIQNRLEDLRSYFNNFKPVSHPDEKPFKGPPIPEDRADQLAEYMTETIKSFKPRSDIFLSEQGSRLVGRYLVNRLAEDKQFGKFIREVAEKLPQKSQVEQGAGIGYKSLTAQLEAERGAEFNLSQHIRTSHVKEPVYRATADYNDLDAEIATVLSREVGAHAGSDEAQAASIIAIRSDPEEMLKFVQGEKGATVSKDEINEYFGNYLGRYEEQQARIKSGEGLRGDESLIELKPYAITKGYVNIQNPLIIGDMEEGWSMGSKIGSKSFMEGIKKLVTAQGANLTKKSIKRIEDMYKEAETYQIHRNRRFVREHDSNYAISGENPSQGEYLDEALAELFNMKMNAEFRGWLQDLGFDGIEYTNTVERSLPKGSRKSYIYFDNKQFKTAWNSKMDPKDPRANYKTGGFVIDGVPTRQDFMDALGIKREKKPVKKARLTDKILSAIQKKRGYTDEEVERVKEYGDDVAFVESNNDPKAVQIVNGKARGAGRGKYQFELEGVAGGSGANTTALKRTKRFLASHGVEDAPELDSLISKKNVDFSTLPEEVQDSIFLADLSEGKAPLDDLAKGKVDKGEFYAKHHWAGARDNPKKERAKAQWFKERIKRR